MLNMASFANTNGFVETALALSNPIVALISEDLIKQ